MERIKDSRSIKATTREMRAIARRAQIMGLNRQMTPAQYQLLDANGIHVLTPIAVHTYADEKPIDPHMRCFAYLKMLGQEQALEKHLDIPFEFLRGFIDDDAPQTEDLILAAEDTLAKLRTLQKEDPM